MGPLASAAEWISGKNQRRCVGSAIASQCHHTYRSLILCRSGWLLDVFSQAAWTSALWPWLWVSTGPRITVINKENPLNPWSRRIQVALRSHSGSKRCIHALVSLLGTFLRHGGATMWESDRKCSTSLNRLDSILFQLRAESQKKEGGVTKCHDTTGPSHIFLYPCPVPATRSTEPSFLVTNFLKKARAALAVPSWHEASIRVGWVGIPWCHLVSRLQ